MEDAHIRSDYNLLLTNLPHTIAVIGVALLIWAPIVWAAALILKKSGHSPWWSIIVAVPILNWFALLIFATSNWPALDGSGPPRS